MSRGAGPRRRSGGEPDPVLEEAAEAVAWVVRRFVASGLPVEAAELEQEAWRAVLETRHNFDPAKAAASTYFRAIVRRSLYKYVSQAIAVVSIHKHYELGAQLQGRTDVYDWQGGGDRRASRPPGLDGDRNRKVDVRYGEEVRDKLGEDPEVALMRREKEQALERWRGRVREILEEVMADWTPWERWVVYRLSGLDGHRPERAGELAERIKVDVCRIYKVHSRLEQALWKSHKIYILHRDREKGWT